MIYKENCITVHCTYIVVHFIQVFFCYHKMHILHTQMVSISLCYFLL